MKQKSYLHSNRSARDMSRPAVFLNNAEKKSKLENQTPTKEKLSQK